MQNFIFCQIFSVLFHPVSFPVLLLPAVPAFSPPDRFPFFPVFRRYSAFFFSCRLFFPSPFFPAFSPPASFSYFCLSDTPLLFSPFSFNPFLHLAFGRFFSPCAFPPEHNISEPKPKHTDASFCRPKCRTRQIIKNLPVTTGMYKKHPTRPTKIPDLKTPAEQILSSPREIRKTTKNKAFPARTKALPVPNRKYRHKRSKNRQPD